MGKREADSRRWAERDEWAAEHMRTWKDPGGREVDGRPITFEARGDVRELEGLAGALSAAGLPTLCQPAGPKSAEVTVIVPAERTAEVLASARTHNAGRKATPIDTGGSPEIDGETTVDAFLAWKESHSAAECMAALGLSRSTYFRRLAMMRGLAEAGKGKTKLRHVG